MVVVLAVLLLVATVACAVLTILWWQERAHASQLQSEGQEYRDVTERSERELRSELEKRRVQVARLAKWEKVADAVDKARNLLSTAEKKLTDAEARAQEISATAHAEADRLVEDAKKQASKAETEARTNSKKLTEQAQVALDVAAARSARILADADEKAREIAGKAYDALKHADLYERTVRAMKNIIEGYGDAYLKPAESLLDELAEGFAHKDAGRQLKLARDNTRAMIGSGLASRCEYVEASRREGAEAFVLDAFNGKVDSILSRVRHDNYGTLEQEIKDAFTLVNFGGRAFREARITDEYLAARLGELKWATVAQELKREEQEEQRQFREWIREEQKAQREFERAMREAAKEEELLRKALAKAESQVAAATAEQRARYEMQLADLKVKLQEAEEKSQRAMSMAQQTKRGHVYVISNIGSFGDHVYKIGLTRRLEPLDRIRELGDASVPFEFDVHAVILSEDAPALETQLHKHFVLSQMNKVNHRKEFFRANLAEIRREIEKLGIDARWTMVAEAREYRETQAIERIMAGDPTAQEAWINRQLTLDPVEVREPVAIGEE